MEKCLLTSTQEIRFSLYFYIITSAVQFNDIRQVNTFPQFFKIFTTTQANNHTSVT